MEASGWFFKETLPTASRASRSREGSTTTPPCALPYTSACAVLLTLVRNNGREDIALIHSSDSNDPCLPVRANVGIIGGATGMDGPSGTKGACVGSPWKTSSSSELVHSMGSIDPCVVYVLGTFTSTMAACSSRLRTLASDLTEVLRGESLGVNSMLFTVTMPAVVGSGTAASRIGDILDRGACASCTDFDFELVLELSLELSFCRELHLSGQHRGHAAMAKNLRQARQQGLQRIASLRLPDLPVGPTTIKSGVRKKKAKKRESMVLARSMTPSFRKSTTRQGSRRAEPPSVVAAPPRTDGPR
mmetsp:Transcript_51144/g.110991  ORF Transcript_51144/g.110991 Transcript_51144/m.110991 type:complete len:303 (+) Transcript_51144:451-1359(+)